MRLHTALGGLLALTGPRLCDSRADPAADPRPEERDHRRPRHRGRPLHSVQRVRRHDRHDGHHRARRRDRRRHQRGGAPGTRLTDLLKSEKAVGTAHAIVLSGGSAYGLAAADGVTTCLASQGVGTPVANGVFVPIVPSAILFDPGRCAPFNFRPDASFGINACMAANNGPVPMGNVGAGAGARSGSVKGGLGTASALLPNGVVVGAIVAINSSGSTFNTDDGPVLRRLHRQQRRT